MGPQTISVKPYQKRVRVYILGTANYIESEYTISEHDAKTSLPIVDMPMMSDEKWKKLAKSSKNLCRLRELGWKKDAATGQWIPPDTCRME